MSWDGRCPACGSERVMRCRPAKANLACSECSFSWRSDDPMRPEWLLGQEEPLTDSGLEAELSQERYDRAPPRRRAGDAS